MPLFRLLLIGQLLFCVGGRPPLLGTSCGTAFPNLTHNCDTAPYQIAGISALQRHRDASGVFWQQLPNDGKSFDLPLLANLPSLERVPLLEGSKPLSQNSSWLAQLGVNKIFGIVLPSRLQRFRRFVSGLGLDANNVDMRWAFKPGEGLDESISQLEACGVLAVGERHGDDRRGLSLGAGEIGCITSHVSVLRDFAGKPDQDPDAFALIFEDDVQPLLDEASLQALQQRMADVMSSLRGPSADPLAKKAGFVNLGRCLDDCSLDMRIGMSSALVKSSNPVCGHAYLVTRAGARAILDHALPIRQPQTALDDAIVQNALRPGWLVGLSAKPRLFEQAEGDESLVSQLGTTSWSRQKGGTGALEECWHDS